MLQKENVISGGCAFKICVFLFCSSSACSQSLLTCAGFLKVFSLIVGIRAQDVSRLRIFDCLSRAIAHPVCNYRCKSRSSFRSRTQTQLIIHKAILYYVTLAIYNIYFHPLSSFPGPRLAAATPWWTALSYLDGRTPYDLLDLHNTYGPVVRTSPDSLSYIKAPQWKEIYGHKAPGQPEFSKDGKYHSALKGDAVIINADREYHSYIRRLFAHGFSEKAMREQEGVLKGFVDVLFARLGEVGEGGRPVDVVQWYNVSLLRIGE